MGRGIRRRKGEREAGKVGKEGEERNVREEKDSEVTYRMQQVSLTGQVEFSGQTRVARTF